MITIRPNRLAPSLALCLALGLAPAACGSGGGGGSSGGASAAPSTGTQPALFAGAAVVDVTPGPGTPLAGFGAVPRRVMNAYSIALQIIAMGGSCFDPDPSDAVTFFAPAQGTLDPITARALVVSNGTTKVAIVKIDAVGATRELHDDVAAVAATLGIPGDNFVLCATHTHSGPGAMTKQLLWELVGADCYNDALYQTFRQGVETALRQADAALRPAEIGIGSAFETAASSNRSGRPGIYDPEIGILKVVEAGSGAPIAALVNFAIHGTALGISNMLFSADVMGVAEREIEQQLGGIAIFTNGAEGDVAPDGGLSAGALLADDTVKTWPAVSTKPWVELSGAAEVVQMPPPSFNTGCFPIPGTSNTICNFLPGFSLSIPLDPNWLSTSAPFKAIRIDRTVFATIPGEAITDIGWEIKARATTKGFERGFVIGLANDHLGYLTTQAEYYRGEYEAMGTLYGPTTGDVAVQAADRVMDRVK